MTPTLPLPMRTPWEEFYGLFRDIGALNQSTDSALLLEAVFAK